jgi:uncharacterized protein (TIGR02996 family)
MTADERALLNAVIAAPDDDLPRLVYADWLEEHGREERAELIRVQCNLARPLTDYREADDRKRWAQRERWLLQRYSVPWRKELPQVHAAEWGRFERGMVESFFIRVWRLTGDAPVQLDEIDALHQHTPLRVLGMNCVNCRSYTSLIPDDWLRWPGMARFQSLKIVGTDLYTTDRQRAFLVSLLEHDWTRGPAVLDLRKCRLTEDALNLLISLSSDRRFPIIDLRRVVMRHEMTEQLRTRFGERALL